MNCRGQQVELVLLRCPTPGNADVFKIRLDGIKCRTLLRALQQLFLAASRLR